jgi:D-galactose 1-dehydrogenase
MTTRCGHEVALLDSGGTLVIDGKVMLQATREEYPMLYARFAELVMSRQSEANLTPLQMTLDALALGKRVALPRFEG